MRIGFVVNDVATEQSNYTSTRLALAASQKGHEVWLLGVGDFVCETDGRLSATAHRPGDKQYKSLDRFMTDIHDPEGVEELDLCTLDVVLLRNDPADDAVERPWAVTGGVAFGRMLVAAGVLVLNDPGNLSHALTRPTSSTFPRLSGRELSYRATVGRSRGSWPIRRARRCSSLSRDRGDLGSSR